GVDDPHHQPHRSRDREVLPQQVRGPDPATPAPRSVLWPPALAGSSRGPAPRPRAPRARHPAPASPPAPEAGGGRLRVGEVGGHGAAAVCLSAADGTVAPPSTRASVAASGLIDERHAGGWPGSLPNRRRGSRTETGTAGPGARRADAS